MDGLDLKLARVRARLALCELGKLAGVHPARISEMERGQRAIAEAVVAQPSTKFPAWSSRWRGWGRARR